MVRKSVRWIALGLLGAALPATVGWGQEGPVAPAQVQLATPAATVTVPIRIALEGEAGQGATYAFEQSTGETLPQGDYWIGIALGELPEVAKQQLQLEFGLVVVDVLPDSPAAKAELKRHDVLIRAGDEPLKEPADILKAVEAAKETELAIVLYRDGKEATLKVSPVKRPKPEETKVVVETANAQVPAGAIQRLEEALAQLKGKAGGEQLGIYFARPGMVMPSMPGMAMPGMPGWSHSAAAGEFPKNMSVRITKEGDQPAKIHVEQDDQEWDVTADKLMELPAEARVHVEQLLSRTIHPALAARAQALVVGGGKGGPYATPGMRVTAPVPAPHAATPSTARFRAYRVDNHDGAEAKLDQILKKLDGLDNGAIEQLKDEVQKLRKEVDELRNK